MGLLLLSEKDAKKYLILRNNHIEIDNIPYNCSIRPLSKLSIVGPLSFVKQFMLVNKRVKEIEYNPMEIKPFRKVSLNEN